MNYAILAAGKGSRLLQGGIMIPKPLIKVCGVTLIDRLIDIFCKNNAESLSIITNERMGEVKQYVKTLQLPIVIPVNKIFKSTMSSMHSFFELSHFLKKGKCCISTIDTIFDEKIFSSFIRFFETSDASIDGIMAVTNFIDDEQPLYVAFNEQTFEIKQFSNYPISQYISGGIYCLTPKAIDLLAYCMKTGMLHMRNYQRQLLISQFKIQAYPFGKMLDIDHADDIIKADFFLKKKSASFQVIGIKRDHQYSPNHIYDDNSIFQLTTEQLKKRGCKVTIYTEKEFQCTTIRVDLIFSMARHFKSICQLKKLEDIGKKIINSGYGIENCNRENITNILMNNHIPIPKSFVISTHDFSISDIATFGTHCWIKRGDFHTLQREDVSYVHIKEEANHVLHKYATRGIQTAVVSEHLLGDLVKFYGVSDTDFFYWFYPDTAHSKFGIEAINGEANGTPFDKAFLKKTCTQIAKILNIYIYGGDCIIDKNGKIKIIDFNDWPSFAPCRQEAAPYIAECIYNQL